MLKCACIHPELIKALAECGHGDKILIADGNYPIESKTGVGAKKVHLNLTHGIPLVTDVLKVLTAVIPIERTEVMTPGDSEEPSIFSEFTDILGKEIKMDKLERFEFYDACGNEEVRLAIATGEQRVFGNILLTVGVMQ
jgi:L-fucose mutarotase